MSNRVADAYDAHAELYASLFLAALDRDEQTVRWLSTFAALAAPRTGPVLDVGCGPGHLTRHLVDHGLDAAGVDVSPGQITEARRAFPDLWFQVGDLTALQAGDGHLGGIVSHYSLIHLPPDRLDGVFREWRRALEPLAPVYLSFFGSRSPGAHGTPFDHRVITAYEFDPRAIGAQLTDAGFERIDVEATPIPEGGRPFDHVTMLAIAPAGDPRRRD